MGYFNTLKLKLIYVARYIFEDQFLFAHETALIHEDIAKRLDAQYAENNWKVHQFDNVPVPSAEWGKVSAKDVFEKYVLPGIPFVLRNVPSAARDKWSPEYFAEKYGHHTIDVINTHEMSVLTMNMSRYVEAHRPEGDAERGNATWYVRALSDIFDSYPVWMEREMDVMT